MVFAADCTYSGELHLHLINVFERLIHTQPNDCDYLNYILADGTFNVELFLDNYNRSCKFGLIACTVRNIDTYQVLTHLLTYLLTHSLTYLLFQDFIVELNKHPKIRYFNISKWCHEATGEQRYYYERKADIEVLLLLPASE